MCRWKRCWIFVAMIGLILVTMSSCGKEMGEKLTNVFEISEMDLPKTIQDIQTRKIYDGVDVSEETIYIGISGDVNGVYRYYIIEVDNTGKCIGYVELPFQRPENGNINISQICSVEKDSIYVFVSGYEYDSDNNYLEIRELWYGRNGEWMNIEACSGLNILSMVSEGTFLLVQTPTGMKKINNEGTIIDVVLEEEISSVEISKIYKINEQIYIQMTEYTQEGMISGIYFFDSETGIIGEEIHNLEGAILSGNGYMFYTQNSIGVFGWTQNGNIYTEHEILSFGNSNIDPNEFTTLAPVTTDMVFAINNDDQILLLNRVPEDELPLLEVISFAVQELDIDLRNKIIDFNKVNTQYHVSAKEYMGNLTQLHLDMVSGNSPDILLINENMPYESYMRQGLFIDLYSMIDKDDVLEKDAFLPNILMAYETNGKLYSIVDRFGIETYSAKTALIEEKAGWTIDDFLVYNNTHEILMFPIDFDYISFVERYVQFSFNELINVDNGMCYFDSKAFQTVLKYIKTLSDISEENSDLQYRNDEMYQTNQILLYDEYVGSFDAYKVTYAYTFGGDAVYIGFPVESGNGALISTDLYGHEFAICSMSENKVGAWEFLRSFLLENEQMPYIDVSGTWITNSGFPVLRSAVEQLYDIAISTPEQSGEQQNKSIWDIPLEVSQADRVYELITETTNRKRMNSEINSILREELSIYFSNGKSLDETIEVIQSRIGLYVSEISQ